MIKTATFWVSHSIDIIFLFVTTSYGLQVFFTNIKQYNSKFSQFLQILTNLKNALKKLAAFSPSRPVHLRKLY